MTVHQPLRPGKYRVQVDDYLILAEGGSFAGARTELIEGEIWVMSPAYSAHARTQARLSYLLQSALVDTSARLQLYVASSIALSADSMPEPDLVLADDHDDGPLPLGKVRLVVEIADATLATDLGRKTGLYAAAAIPEYWVADVNGRVIHQMWAPAGAEYTERREVAFGDAITARTVPDLTIVTPT